MWFSLAVAIDTAIALVDAALGARVIVIGLLAVGPWLAAAQVSGWWTAVVGGYAVMLAVASHHAPGLANYIVQCLVVAVGGCLAVLAACIRARRETALRRMTLVADAAQRAMVCAIPPAVGGVAFAHRYRSATEDARIGGDLYDVAQTPAGLRLIIGDVKGKGLPAIDLAATVLRAFRETVFTADDLVQLAKELDARIEGELSQEDFVTILLAEFTPGEVRLVNCGHHPPVRIGHRLEWLSAAQPEPPIGLRPQPVLQRARLAAGERILFYTDGLAEARDRYKTFFSLDERARELLTAPLLEDALQGLLDLVDSHTGSELGDDLALVLAQPSLDPIPAELPAPGHVLPGMTRPVS